MAQKMPEFEEGDHVSWSFGKYGTATGHVTQKLIKPTKMGSKQFRASPEAPMYKIKNDKTGSMTIRNPGTLDKVEDDLEEDDEPEENLLIGDRPSDSSREEEAADLLEGSRGNDNLPTSDIDVLHNLAAESVSGGEPADAIETAKEPATRTGGESPHEQEGKETEAPHKLPHLEVPQPGDFPDTAAVDEFVKASLQTGS